MPLFQTLPVDKELVKKTVKENWDVELGDCLKSSQNHTFLTTNDKGEKFILRVTPDPTLQRVKSTELELSIVEFLSESKLPVCCPIRTNTDKSLMVITSDNCILSLSLFSKGEPVVYTDWKWLTTKEIVFGLGQWFGKLHQLIPKFNEKNPELVKNTRLWTELHDGILKEVPVDEADKKLIEDSTKFNIIHGDVNPSNYYWDPVDSIPVMFDWDQLQRSWLFYDLSAPIYGVQMLETSGSPLDGSKVPQANLQQYIDWLLEGYESITNIKSDRDHLMRMVSIRRQLYYRFCRKALDELPEDHPMYKFCKNVTEMFDKQDSQ